MFIGSLIVGIMDHIDPYPPDIDDDPGIMMIIFWPITVPIAIVAGAAILMRLLAKKLIEFAASKIKILLKNKEEME